jgi:hypothetical protein
MGKQSDTDRVANRIAIGALIVAIGGLVYQQIQIAQIEKGLELANSALILDRKAEGRRLLDEALDVLTTSPGVQYELRHVGEPLPALVSPPDFSSRGCELSQVDRAALARAGDLLASAIDADPAVPGGLDRLIAISSLLKDPALLTRVRPALAHTDGAKRIEILEAALQDDSAKVEKLAMAYFQDPKSTVILKRAAIDALMLTGRSDAAEPRLAELHAEHWQDAGTSYAYARLLLRDPGNRASLDKALDIARSSFVYDVKRPHFQLLEHDALVSMHRFPEAWKVIDKLREQGLFVDAVIPYPWTESVSPPINAAPQAQLDGIDVVIKHCPSARSALEAERASLLMSLGRCDEALVAVSKTMAEEWQVDLYRAMTAAPRERVAMLQAMEADLASHNGESLENGSSTGFLAYALWSLANDKRPARAAALAAEVRAQRKRFHDTAAPEVADKLEMYPFLLMAGNDMSVDKALAALDELAASPAHSKKRSKAAAVLDANLTRSSRQFLAEKSMCKS